ncbi:MAG: ATP-binding cassette domain-containing protein [Verrucomicrobiales bacterium]|nr:ATP-binding cassette domain-containing protein [Verrucomicrobiales bacterium]
MDIELSNATKTVSRTTILDSFCLSCHSGEIVAVAGFHSSGKTTLLRALAGAVTLNSGELRYGGKSVFPDDPVISQSCFFLPATPPLVPGETVLRNISRFLTRHPESGESDQIVENLKRFDLVEHAQTPVLELSEDHARRVVFAVAATLNLPVWILDEPFSGELNDKTKSLIKEILQEATRAGKTVIYSNSEVEPGDSVATRICVINRGQKYADCPPGELKKRAETDHLLSRLTGIG